MAEQFWMVQGADPATVRHTTREAAETEAKRLARRNPGTEFYVMEAVTMVKKIDIVSVNLRARPVNLDEELPF